MDISWITAVSGFAVAMAATPGPNNTLVTAAGANHGFRRSLPLMLGIAFGVTALIFTVGAFGTSLVNEPHIRNTLKWLGLAYLSWLAWKIGSTRPTMPDTRADQLSAGTPPSFVQGVLLQFINPKLWVMIAGAVITYGSEVPDQSPLAIASAFSIIFGTATFASVILWALIGIGAGRVLRTQRQMQIFNIGMAGMLVASLVPVVSS